jgi:hypothetical protein
MKNITRRYAMSLAAAGAASTTAFATMPGASAEPAENDHAWMARESIRDLETYYAACWASAEALMGVKNRPRCLNGTVVHRKIDAAMVAMHTAAERTAEHVLRREPSGEREAYCRQRILLHWYSNLDDPEGELALARELIAFHGKEA